MKKGVYLLIIFYCLLPIADCFAQQSKSDSLLSILKTSKQDTTVVNALNALFLQYEYTDDKKAGEYLKQAFELSQKIDYQKGLAAALTNLGYSSEDKGDYPQAIIHYNAALKILERSTDKKGIAASYNNIGNVYFQSGNYQEALKNYFASLKKREAIGDKAGIAATYGNIGSIYFTQGNHPDALKNYFASMKIRKTIGDKKGAGTSYNNIGNVYYAQGDYEAAYRNYTASLEIKEEMGDKRGAAVSYNNIALIYSNEAMQAQDPVVRAAKLDKALQNNFASLEIRETLGDKAGIAACYGNIGDVYTKLKKYKEAEEYLLRSKQISIEIGHTEYLRNTYGVLAALDSSRGNFKGAFQNYKLFVLYRDSLDNEETQAKTIQGQMTYDFEKKEAVANAEHKKELENQEILAEEKSRKQKIILLFVVAGLLLVVVFAGFIFRSLRITRSQKNIIEEQKNVVEQQKQEVEQQKHLVEDHQKAIIDSITYARRIQRSQLPTEKYIDRTLKRLMKFAIDNKQ